MSDTKGKIFAVGDIHGELWKLQELFNRLSITKNDKVIFLGDYIDRGERSRGVIDFIIDLKAKYNVVCLKGNHEQFALDAIKGEDIPMFASWMRNGGHPTLKNYNFEVSEMDGVHGDFLRGLELIHETENHIFVHGYLSHDKDIKNQVEELCLWARYDDIKPHKSGKIVVCGHTIQRVAVDGGFKICIDTGSFKQYGFVTAMEIDGNKTRFITSG